jgi:hypothetical protein
VQATHTFLYFYYALHTHHSSPSFQHSTYTFQIPKNAHPIRPIHLRDLDAIYRVHQSVVVSPYTSFLSFPALYLYFPNSKKCTPIHLRDLDAIYRVESAVVVETRSLPMVPKRDRYIFVHSGDDRFLILACASLHTHLRNARDQQSRQRRGS